MKSITMNIIKKNGKYHITNKLNKSIATFETQQEATDQLKAIRVLQNHFFKTIK